MKYDLIISNPPYGAPGNGITKNIVENVDYGAFVNLLPSNDYRRYNKDFKLYQFVDLNTIRPIMKGFKDATVTTTLCMVMKERQYSRTQSEFEIENYMDKSLKRYFYENRRRNHYAIDNFMAQVTFNQFERTTVEKSFYIGYRDPKDHHLPYSMDSITTRYNMNKVSKEQVIEESSKSMQARGQVGQFSLIAFDTESEKTNFSNFVYSENGFRFISKVMSAITNDGYIPAGKYMPKVDWTKSQTVESILKDYGYTEQEIQEVMKDLKRFKGFDQSYTSEDEFEIENYIDKSLKKYFYEVRRHNYAGIDNSAAGMLYDDFKKIEVSKSIYLGDRVMGDKHLPYDMGAMTNKYNMGNVTKEELIEKDKHRIEKYGRMGHYYIIPFDTELERNNFVNFMYSKDGFRFFGKLFTALNLDGSVQLGKVFPKVDWTRPQTVESILLDYNYTQAEIAEILDDLKNYRYMDDTE